MRRVGLLRTLAQFAEPSGIPVGTVRLLLSPLSSEVGLVAASSRWQEADDESVAAAVQAWADDCDSDPRNVAVLYVGGHGVASTAMVQYCFLSSANQARDRYSAGVNLNRITDAMGWCRARNQIFIYDCCAVRASEDPGPVSRGIGIRSFPRRDGPGREKSVTISTRLGTESYALGVHEGTLLSWALLDGEPTRTDNQCLGPQGKPILKGIST